MTSDNKEVAIDEGLQQDGVRDSGILQKSGTVALYSTKRLGSMRKHWGKGAIDNRNRARARNVPQIFGEHRTYLVVEGD